MKKNIIMLGVMGVLLFISCGPAAEDREQMHKRAKIFQDSIAHIIKTSMDEAAIPGPKMVALDTAKKVIPITTPTAK
jgi:hypothetical protein